MTTLGSIIAALTFFLMPANTTLYTEGLGAIVDLPAGYFVMRSDLPAPDGYVSVIYDDLSGYVRITDVREVDYTPVTKYELTAKFRCDNDGQSVNLRSAPNRSAAITRVLAPRAEGRLYGETRGDALIKYGDTLWYYVSIDGVKGYVYYAHVDVDPIPANIIEKEPEKSDDEPTNADPENPDFVPPTAVIILIVALCLPVPFIMFYLFRKPKN